MQQQHGRLDTLAQAGRGTFDWDYDAYGRVASLTDPEGKVTGLEYDTAGRPWRRTLGNGLREERSWDARGRLSAFALKTSGGSSLRSESWGYSARSDVLSHTVGSVETLYAYDDEGQLLSESRPGYATAYTYDGNGNRKTRTVNSVLEEYAYDSGDKLASVVSGGNARTFTYDLAGRMLTDSLGSRSFAWTADSRLKSLTASTGSETYTYSAFGTRAKVGTRTFLRAGAGVTAGVLDDGNAVYTPGVSEKRGSVTTFSHSGLKNTGAQTDAPGSGDPSVAATREYDAFGSPTAASGSWQGPFGYAGQFGYEDSAFADPLGGLHLLGHRYYDASLGRFLTRDPIGDGSNWYVYCVNDPVAFVDLEGLNHKGSKEWTAHTRIRMVVAPPGYESIGGRYWFGHSWVEIENPDETVDIYENNIGGNYHSSRMASDLLRDGVYYREMLVPRPRYRPSDGEFWYGGIVNNCISFTRVVWRENGGDAPLWQYIRPGLMGPAQLSAKLAQRDTPQGLFDDYDGWRRR